MIPLFARGRAADAPRWIAGRTAVSGTELKQGLAAILAAGAAGYSPCLVQLGRTEEAIVAARRTG